MGPAGREVRSGLIGKIILLAVITAIAVWLAIPLVAAEMWLWLAVVVATTLALYAIYLQPWHIPIKYLVPGTIFLILFQIIPVVFTFTTAFTNFGDGHRGTKDEAITSIQGGIGPAGPGLGAVRPDDRHRGRSDHRRPGLPAHGPGDQGRPAW